MHLYQVTRQRCCEDLCLSFMLCQPTAACFHTAFGCTAVQAHGPTAFHTVLTNADLHDSGSWHAIIDMQMG